MLENIPPVSGKGSWGNRQHIQPKPHSQLYGNGDSRQGHSLAGSTHLHPKAASAANHPREMPGQGAARRHPSQGTCQQGRPGFPQPGHEQAGIFMAKRAGLPSPGSSPETKPRKVFSNIPAFMCLTIALAAGALMLV